MKVYYECGACFLRQAKEAIELATDDEELKFKLIKDILSFVGENFSKELSSNATGTRIHQYIKKETGCFDPYINEKKQGNEIALSLMPKVREILKEDDSLETYVKIAIVGNILDFGAFDLGTDIESLIFEGLEKELIINKIDEFEEALKKYDKVLYLVDNTGEIVFDKLLLEKIKDYGVDITVAVKENPILNDACMEEALEAGLDEVANLITTGSDSVGVVESMISDDFKEYLKNSPFIISKGMGNYEGLTEMNLEGQDVFVLFCTKCNAISKDLGVKEGSHILTTL
ncbi:damage-control phosphatase ARMT1 family protein [Methanobrevibacter olleyae]|uniref:damage-control phosphatase ARMT1 family protein n=1 Tax=Methanobrevibacter olleyae TaxID=294671 RepID=UPI000942A153|nr:ARMT1-like domain-containing protein [Methanobrevibacter olleyae]